jgi:molybdopterin converting factor small subunit
MEKGESDRQVITTSTPQKKKKKKKKRKERDLRVEILKKNMLERFYSEEAASYAYKSSHVKPEPNIGAASTVVSKWARDADSDLRTLLLCKRGNHNSKAGAEARVMILEEMSKEKPHKGYHYSSEKETRKRQIKRKNRDAAGGPALKRRRLTLLTFISLEDSEDIVQALGNTISSGRSDLPKIKEEIYSGDERDDVLVMDTDEDLMEMDTLLNNFTL